MKQGQHCCVLNFLNELCSWLIYSCFALQGLDVSAAMLDVAQERGVEGDVCLHDLGQGLPLRPGTFDGAISISAVQWLCNAVRAALPHASSSTRSLCDNQCRPASRPARTQALKRLLSFKCPARLLL